MNLKEKVTEFYGNSGYGLDFLLAIIFSIALLILKVDLGFMNDFIIGIDGSTISFFGIVIGFLLTTFSLLFLYNPEHSQDLMRLRKLKEYKNMLYSFISTAFILIILVIFVFIIKIFTWDGNFINYSLFGLCVFSFLRIIKCIFYLFVIISLS